MDEKRRKTVLKGEMKKNHKGKNIISSKYIPKYPYSIEREYLHLVNEYMTIEKEILIKYIPELKRIISEGTLTWNVDSKKDNEKKRKHTRFEKLENTLAKLRNLFDTIFGEMAAAFLAFRLEEKLNKIARLGHKFSIKEWKKVIRKTLGMELLDDYYSSAVYEELMKKWVSDNVELIRTIPKNSLGKMKELVYENFMKGTNTTSIVEDIQKEYKISKNHARLIARDQTAKLNAAITKHQQKDVGITHYKWSSSGDEDVRDCHKRLDGKIFAWNSPPQMWYKSKKKGKVMTGRYCHPGEDIQCRCCAIPIFNMENLDLPV